MFKHGRFSRETRELGQALRGLAHAVDVFGAVTMTAAGGKPHRAVRRKRHVKRALAEAKTAKEGEKTE